jgi:hypothetical protein
MGFSYECPLSGALFNQQLRNYLHRLYFICSLFNDTFSDSDCRPVALNDWVTVDNELKRLWTMMIIA